MKLNNKIIKTIAVLLMSSPLLVFGMEQFGTPNDTEQSDRKRQREKSDEEPTAKRSCTQYSPAAFRWLEDQLRQLRLKNLLLETECAQQKTPDWAGH